MAGFRDRKIDRRLARVTRRRAGLHFPLQLMQSPSSKEGAPAEGGSGAQPLWIGRIIPEDAIRLCLDPHLLTGGNLIKLLKDGREAFPAMLRAIEDAQETICLESYIFRSDKTGWRFAEALSTKSRIGVQVLVIYDAVGSRSLDSRMFAEMRKAGVRVLEYHPIAPWRKGWGWWRRNHRKLLVVDSRIGFTGGINICDDHADPFEGGGGWRDTDIQVQGPAARELQRLFLSTWRDERGESIDERNFLPRAVEPVGDAVVGVIGTREFRSRRTIRRAYLHAMKSARKSVAIANAYFAPDRGILRALRNAAERGVDVRILLSSRSDVPPVKYAGRALYARLLRWGVRIFEWQGPVLHAKTAVVDRAWSTIGSYNIDHRSVFHNLELNVTILGTEFGMQMEDMFEKDLIHSTEITPQEWRKRPWAGRLLERAFHTLRHWL